MFTVFLESLIEIFSYLNIEIWAKLFQLSTLVTVNPTSILNTHTLREPMQPHQQRHSGKDSSIVILDSRIMQC